MGCADDALASAPTGRGGLMGVVLSERRKDLFGEYEERWMVEPPAEGVLYRVREQSWNEDYSVRTIWRVELSDG